MRKIYIILLSLSLIILTGCQNKNIPGFGGYFNSDEQISANVQTAFNDNEQLFGVPIHIETNQGVVELSGYVKTIRQSDVALDLAGKVEGVKQVQNGLIVRKR